MMDSETEADGFEVGIDAVTQVANDGEELACRSPGHEIPSVQWTASASSIPHHRGSPQRGSLSGDVSAATI